jgi:hypothetical protein
MRAAFHSSSSTPRRPASRIAITSPLACQTAASTTAYITLSCVTIQSKVKPSKPNPRTVAWMPSSGFSIHCQIRPVATKDIAYGYKKTVRNTPSSRTRWSMNTASKKPITMQALMKSTPNSATLCSETIQRSVPNRRSYCISPTKSSRAKVLALLNDTRTDHSTVPM